MWVGRVFIQAVYNIFTGIAMAVIQGGSYGPRDSFPDGTVFIGCTFYSSCTFGDGCVFIDCNLVKKKKTPHSVGNGASMSGGFVENTVFGDGVQIGNTGIGDGVQIGNTGIGGNVSWGAGPEPGNVSWGAGPEPGNVSWGAGPEPGNGGTEQEGEAITQQGPPMQGSIMLEKDWCKSWTCRAPYIDANIIGTVNAPVKVTCAGTEYSFPASG